MEGKKIDGNRATPGTEKVEQSLNNPRRSPKDEEGRQGGGVRRPVRRRHKGPQRLDRILYARIVQRRMVYVLPPAANSLKGERRLRGQDHSWSIVVK